MKEKELLRLEELIKLKEKEQKLISVEQDQRENKLKLNEQNQILREKEQKITKKEQSLKED